MKQNSEKKPSKKDIQKQLNSIFRMLRDLRNMMKYFLGTYSNYVGKAAEQLTASIIAKINEMGGINLGGVHVGPIEILSRNLKGENYEIDLIGVDDEKNIWIVETTTYPIFDLTIANKIYRRIKRWYNKNKQSPCFILFAYGGIEKGIYAVLENELKKICKKVILLDKIQARSLLEILDSNK